MKHISIYGLIFTIIFGNIHQANQFPNNNEEKNSSCAELQINEKCEGISNDISYLTKYNHKNSSFVTTLKNIGSNDVPEVYIRIFLSDGRMLGPQKIIDIMPNNDEKIFIECDNSVFSWWSFHITFQEGQNKKMVENNNQKTEENNAEKLNAEINNKEKSDNKAEPNKANIRVAEPVTESIHKGEQSNTEIRNAEKSNADVKNAEKSEDDIKNAEKSEEDIENAKEIK